MNKVLLPYTDSALRMNTTIIFKSSKFYRHMVQHVPEEKQLKRELSLESAKKRSVCYFEGNLCFRGVLIVIAGNFKFI